MNRRCLLLGLLAVATSLAPAGQEPRPPDVLPAPPQPAASLAEQRAGAGARAFDLAWLYYSENRVDSEKVYRWSRRLLEADRDVAPDQAGRLAASQAHRVRLEKLAAKIRKIRRIGFGDSLDVLEVDYYVKEADYWIEQARAGK